MKVTINSQPTGLQPGLRTTSGAYENISSGTIAISANIDGAGHATSGSLKVYGSFSTYSGLLLDGTLADFGFNSSGAMPLQFLFTVDGGSAAGLFGEHVGTLLRFTLPTTLFGASFASATPIQADTHGASVPEHSSTVVLLGISLLALCSLGLLPGRLHRIRRQDGGPRVC